MAAGEVLSDAALAAVGASLVDSEVRETLIRAVGSGEAPEGESLWLLLARVLIGPWRALALMMVTTSAFVRGDGQLAEAAIAAAAEDLADRFSEQMLVVLVDPADVVSVPTHGDAEKRRVCRLFVAARHDGDQLAQAVVDHICTVPDFDAGWDFAGRPETAVRRSVWPATSRLPDDLDEDEDDDSGY